jgi:hypothetical protein
VKQIRWEHWVNPLGGGQEYVEGGEELENEPKPYDDDGEIATAVRPVIPTAAGLIPLNVYGSFATNFNFWMMHTNFNLSSKVVNILKKIDGVETCDVVSRYRARIGFGKCFKSSDVKEEIKYALTDQPQKKPGQGDDVLWMDDDTRQKILLLEQQAKGRYKHWAIYVIPNGQIAFAHAEDDKEYEKYVELFQQTRELAGGLVFTSHDK